jgi:RNA polymerase sigma-70 factor, ECF subfamily
VAPKSKKNGRNQPEDSSNESNHVMTGQRQGDVRAVETCTNGDQDAFRVLYDTYKDRVYSIALHFTGHEEAARDITQETFLKLFRNAAQYRGDSSFVTWLYRVVVNACMDERRRRRRFLLSREAAEERKMAQHDAYDDRLIRLEIAESVQSAIVRLTPRLRIPILLRYVEGLSYDEIAKVLGCSKGTVASRLNRGHKFLARRLRYLRGAKVGGP